MENQKMDISNMWHPFATSTPVKTSFSSYKQLQKQLIKPADVIKAFLGNGINQSPVFSNVNVNANPKSRDVKKPKKLQVNKTSKYFEVSSSEDEDCPDKVKSHDIKIKFETNSNHKSILGNKSDRAIFQNGDADKTKDSDLSLLSKDSENKNILTKNKVRISNISKRKTSQNKIISSLPIVQQNTNIKYEPSKTDKSKEKIVCKAVKKNVLLPNNDDNIKKIVTVDKKNNVSRVLNNLTIENQSNVKLFNNALKKLEPAVNLCNLIKNEKNEEILKSKSFQISKAQTSKIPKLVSNKRKGNDKSTPPRKIRKKTSKLEKNELLIEKSISPLMSKKKKNLSHQLFSDSKEQELLNSLDLTVLEPNEGMSTSLLLNKNQNKNSSKNLSQKNESGKRSVRQKQKPKQYWLPSSTLPENDKAQTLKGVEQSSQNKGLIINKNSEPMLNKIDNKKDNKDPYMEPKPETILKNLKLNVHKNMKKTFVKNQEGGKELIAMENSEENSNRENKVGNKRKSPLASRVTRSKVKRTTGKPDMKRNCSPVSSSVQKNEKHDMKESILLDVFQKLGEIPFSETQPGCFTSECWALKGFKCGMLKVSSNSEISSKTAHKKNYFGGVLIKNKLKMKIGTNEFELGEGDTVFVPPLTEWSAVNETQSDSVFYYWCFGLKS